MANRMGLSTQVPFTQEINSNFAPALVRKTTIKNKQYIIRKPVVEITEENVPVLQFLDCLKDLEKCTELEPEKCGKILTEYARKNDITKKKIDRFIINYPLKIYKAIYETEVEYVSS